MGYLACIKSDDGMTFFTRNCNSSSKLPLGLETSLNTLFAFGNKHDAKVHSADSNNHKIVWKMFHSNITLILVEELMPVDERVYFDKIDLLFDALVFMYGIDDLINVSNAEKFKKEITITYNLLDAILDTNSKFNLFGGYLTGCFDSIVTSDSNILQLKLNESLEQINTSYGALFFNGRIIVASTAWMELNSNESYLISMLCLTSSHATSRDIPIYLPHKNPNQALRLLTYNLTSNNIVICFICSEKPSVDFVETNLLKTWHPIYQSLVNLKQYVPRMLADSVILDKNMIGFLLINKRTKYCFSSLFPNDQTQLASKIAKERFDLLKQCYLNISTNFFKKYFKSSLKLAENEYDETTMTTCPEAYTLINEFKCYALNETDNEFYALFNSSIPTYALRGVTKSCFTTLTNRQF